MAGRSEARKRGDTGQGCTNVKCGPCVRIAKKSVGLAPNGVQTRMHAQQMKNDKHNVPSCKEVLVNGGREEGKNQPGMRNGWMAVVVTEYYTSICCLLNHLRARKGKKKVAPYPLSTCEGKIRIGPCNRSSFSSFFWSFPSAMHFMRFRVRRRCGGRP